MNIRSGLADVADADGDGYDGAAGESAVRVGAYRALFQHTSDAVLLVDASGVVDANPAAVRGFGCHRRRELVGRSLADLSATIQPDGRATAEAVTDMLDRVHALGTLRVRWLFRRQDGCLAASPTRVDAVTGAGGQTLFQLVAEGLGQEPERPVFAERSPHPVLSVDDGGSLLYANPAARRLAQALGLDAENPLALLPEAIVAHLARAAREERGELHLCYRVGGRRLELAGYLIAGTGRCQIYLSDITECERAERARRESEQRYRAVFETSSDAIMLEDEHGIIDCNPAAVSMFGCTSKEALIGLHPLDFSPRLQPDGTPSEHAIEPIMEQARIGRLNRFEWTHLRHNGEPFLAEIWLSTLTLGDRRVYQATVRDVTESRRLTRELEYQSTHDALTGLLNRGAFKDRLDRLLDRTTSRAERHTLLYIDVDQFKVVNDSGGHEAGDRLLRQLAGLLRAEINSSDLLGRMGGDEFGVLLTHCAEQRGCELARGLIETINRFRYVWHGRTFQVGASIGLVEVDDRAHDLDLLLRAADAACYAAKSEGRNRLRVYSADDRALARQHGDMALVARLYEAIEHDRFLVYFQRIEPLRGDDGSRRYELLLRMCDDDGRLILPGVFIPAAERYNVIGTLDRWVVSQALEGLATRLREDATLHDEVCSINISAQTLNDEGFPGFVRDRLCATGVPARSVCFEITETAVASSLSRTVAMVSELRGLGCRFALDDFGVGLSSFGFLRSLDVQYLKLDGSFVRRITEDPVDRAMVESFQWISRSLGLSTVAEFVENDAIKAELQDIGVDFAQGFGIHEPEPAVWVPANASVC